MHALFRRATGGARHFTIRRLAGAVALAFLVSALAAPMAPVISADGDVVNDEFARAVDNSWGSARIGGRYSLSGRNASFAVNGSAGVITLTGPRLAGSALLNAVDHRDADAVSTFSLERLPERGQMQVAVRLRVVGDDTYYMAVVSVSPSGTAVLSLQQSVAGLRATIGSPVTLTSFRIRPSRKYLIRTSVVGRSPTVLRAKVWPARETQPHRWTMTRRSSTPALQRAGGVGVHLRTSPLFRAPRARLLVESFVVRVPSQSVEGPGEPPVPPPPGEEPPEVGRLVGYGSRVTGGSRVVRVSSLAELRAAIAPGNHVVIEGSGTWNLAGNDLKVDVRDFTLDNRQAGVVFRGGALRIEKGAGNVLIRGVKSRPGDEYGDAQALDAITVNAEDGQIRGLYFDHVEAWWGPDVTFAILGDVADVTLDGVIVAGGLLRSDHPESRDGDGHGMGLNITALSNQRTGPQRITIYRSLIALNQTRNPQLRQAGPVDIIDSVIYGHGEAPYGNADGGLNIVGTIYRRGANSEPTASLGAGAFEAVPWRAVAKDGYLTPRSVYVANVVAQGFTFAPIDPRVVALSPAAPLSVASNGPNLEAVLSYVGGRSDRVSQDLFDDVRNGTGRYFNGSGLPGPNPYWY